MRRPQPLFLERQTYRHRRMADASRILPVVGVVLFLLPLLWTGARTASGAIYLFLVWGALILVAALLARPLDRLQREDAPPGGEDG